MLTRSMLTACALLFSATAALAEPLVLTDAQMDKVTAGAFQVTSFGVGVLTIIQTGPSSGSARMVCDGSCGVTVTATDSQVVTQRR